MTGVQLRLRDIRKSFGGVEVLHAVDLDAAGGSVLALLGENGAGKSTLVKILAGDYQADSGTITVDEDSFETLTPPVARKQGIRMIHQEFQDAGPLTVAENISLGRWPGKRGFVSWKTVRSRAEQVLDQMGVDIDPMATVGSLRVGERQVVEIARALADSARILVLDEPTAALSQQEVDRLFEWVRRLRERGVCIIYITHRLDEVAELSDRVQVLRNGNVALVEETKSVTRRELVQAMVGRDIGEIRRPPARTEPLGDSAIELSGISIDEQIADVSFDVKRGEVVCLYGKLGSGTSQVAEICFGLQQPTSGTVRLSGEQVELKNLRQAMHKGVGYLPPDRKREGAFMNRPVAENLAIASWQRLALGNTIIDRTREAKAYGRWETRLNIKSNRPSSQPISTLSGGNQQKVLLGRWLERSSDPLVLVEPTRGVDVGARQEIYAAMRSLAEDGNALLVVTSDYEEAVQVADRVLVMSRGRVVAELTDDEITTAELLEKSGG